METLRSLLERTQQGDIDAFGEVVRRFQDMAFGCAYAVLGNRHDAEDATQEAFLAAYRKLGDLRDMERFPGWLRRLVLTACNRVQRRAKAPATSLADATTVPSPNNAPARRAESAEMREAVLAAIRSLPPANRMATMLFYINGYSIHEVANFLDVPEGTVKYRLHESRKALKERMTAMVDESLKSQRPGPELRQRILDELMARKARFDEASRQYHIGGDLQAPPKPDPKWAAWWHERRMKDVRANAALYGISADETFPRMLPEYRQCETFRDDFKDIPRRWGVPDGTRLLCLREFCRQVGAAPLAVHRWETEGMPLLRYYPWLAYDEARASEWVRKRGIRPHEKMTPREGREPMLLVLRALAARKASVAECLEIYHGLATYRWQQPDPLWANEWEARRPAERNENARQYGLSEPTRNWLGIRQDVLTSRVFEIRDFCRRLGLSPFDVIRWTREGMPCLRWSPYIRWDVEQVAVWLAERNLLPSREYTPNELDRLEDFVMSAVAAGTASPQDGRDIFTCWVGVM